MDILTDFSFWFKIYAIILSLIAAIKSSKKVLQLWKTRYLRKVWGIKDGETVTLICSELDNPEQRQNVEPREFIYNLKYGDVDAYFEVVVTLLRLYPKLKLKILSCGEAQATRIDISHTLILIGGPDYNSITQKILDTKLTQFYYKSPYLKEKSLINPHEIVIYHQKTKKEFCELEEFNDYGYFERIYNPHNPKKYIILIGGCHTIGVTASSKAFSLSSSEYGEISNVVLANSKKVIKKINKNSEFSILIQGTRVGQSIQTPQINSNSIFKK